MWRGRAATKEAAEQKRIEHLNEDLNNMPVCVYVCVCVSVASVWGLPLQGLVYYCDMTVQTLRNSVHCFNKKYADLYIP